jgi:hypothetical protein
VKVNGEPSRRIDEKDNGSRSENIHHRVQGKVVTNF